MNLTTHIESAAEREFFEECVRPTNGMTDEQLRSLLDSWSVKYQPKGSKYNLATCPLCGEKEGEPAVWLNNGQPCFMCFRATTCNGDPKKTFGDLRAHFARPAESKLPCINALELPKRFPHQRRDVIPGLLRVGDVANIVGGPKTRKSFFAMQLLIAVASGTQFLGWPTVQGRVRLFDNELRGDDLTRRMVAMVAALRLKWEDVAANIDITPLRGSLADLKTLRNEMCQSPNTYSLFAVDALYKALPNGTDENSNSDMTAAYIMLDESAEKHNAAVACIHHTSKGNQAGKSVSDMGSGAGAQSRSADVHIVLREHEVADTVVLQAVVRSQRPIEPLCMTFDWPLWRLAPDKNPAQIAVPTKKPVPTIDAFVQTIPVEPSPKTEVLAWSKTKLCTSKAGIQALLQESIERGLVEVERPGNLKLPHTIRRLLS